MTLLRKAAGGKVLLNKLRVAATLWQKTRGLLGRKKMDADEGLLIPRCWCVHTFFMRFRIGLIFVDAENVVVSVRKDVGPWRFAYDRRAEAVVECAADSPALADVTAGDKLEILDS
jgi:hypothetical protein